MNAIAVSTFDEPDVRTHFQLHETPFTREVHVEKRYRNPDHDEVLRNVIRCVVKRMSCGIFAPAGVGKSVLLRALEAVLPGARFRVRYVYVNDLSKRDLCREICAAVGCAPAGNYGSLVARLREHWQRQFDEESLRPVLIIDEAQDIRTDVLRILRVLTNFQMDSRLVVSLVLAGQSTLRDRLRGPDMEAIRSRLVYYGSLRLLTRKESRDYVLHRLAMVGASTPLFDEEAHDALFEAAQGNMRALDCLALASMEEAALAKDSVVGMQHVIRARPKVHP